MPNSDTTMVTESISFFDREISFDTEPVYEKLDWRIANIMSFAPIIEATYLYVDHFNCTLKLGHYNPALTDVFGEFGFNSVSETWFDNFVTNITKEELQMVINTINNAIRNNYPGDKWFYFSFNISLIKINKTRVNFRVKVVPHSYTGVKNETPWGIIYYFEPNSEETSLNLMLHSIKTGKKHFYISPKTTKLASELSPLTEEELKIICLSSEGYSESEISTQLKLSLGSVVQMKSHIFEKLRVRTIVDAIKIVYLEGLIK